MQAKCFCPEHNKLDFDKIAIKNGVPVCGICGKELQFGTVRPRLVEKNSKKK